MLIFRNDYIYFWNIYVDMMSILKSSSTWILFQKIFLGHLMENLISWDRILYHVFIFLNLSIQHFFPACYWYCCLVSFWKLLGFVQIFSWEFWMYSTMLYSFLAHLREYMVNFNMHACWTSFFLDQVQMQLEKFLHQ